MTFPTPDITQRPDLAPAVKTAAIGALNPAASAPTTAFSDVLNRRAMGPIDPTTKAHQQAEQAAGDLVANALILPVLKQLRRSPWGENTVFSGGIGEKTFGPQFDMQIADRIAHSPRMAVTQSLAARLEKKYHAAAPMKKLDQHG